jgi:Right handed beta helix region
MLLVLIAACADHSSGPTTPVQLTAFYAAPSGTPSGTGSQSQPWDLATALSGGNGRVQAGDTVWLLGGHYAGDFKATLTGTASAPIIVRQYPAQRATVDGRFEVDGGYTWYWGFEIMYSDPQRLSSQTGPWPTDLPREFRQVDVEAPGTRLINLAIHDVGEIGVWADASDAVVYGCVIYNNGWFAPDRGHGHGIYTQNQAGTKTIEDNVIFNQFGKGIQAYGSDAYVDNYVFQGNVSFNNGSLAGGRDQNYLVGGTTNGSHNIVFTHNYSFIDQEDTGQRFGDGPANDDIDLSDNYFVGFTDINDWQQVKLTGTTFVGWNTLVQLTRPASATYAWNDNSYTRQDQVWDPFGFNSGTYDFAGWQSATGYDGGSSYVQGPPTGTKIAVEPNAYEAGRANVVVYNWSGLASVSVDLSQVLEPGQGYEVRNAEDYFAAPVASGTYDGGLINLPMTGLSVAQPIGNAPYPAPATAPTFNVFIVLPTTP